MLRAEGYYSGYRCSCLCLGGKAASGDLVLSNADVLQWLTGARSLPVMGFQSNISVTFHHEAVLPSVGTCGLELFLPVNALQTPGSATTSWIAEMILSSAGFGKV